MATYARWQRNIVDLQGNVQPSAQVYVYRETDGGLATLYGTRTGSGGAIGNPITADLQGFAFFHAAGGAYRLTVKRGTQTVADWRYVALGTGGEEDLTARAKHVALCNAQSNGSMRTFAWSPPPNLYVWNGDFTTSPANTLVPGTAFVAADATLINPFIAKWARIAEANPGTDYYVISIRYPGSAIAQWLTGASAPAVYDATVTETVRALGTIGKDKIDSFDWWQGESNAAAPTTYAATWETVHNQFVGNSWFPLETPIAVWSLASDRVASLGASPTNDRDRMNAILQGIAQNLPEQRRFVPTATLVPFSNTYWEAEALTQHLTALGCYVAGRAEAHRVLTGANSFTVPGGRVGMDSQRWFWGVGPGFPVIQNTLWNDNPIAAPTPPAGTFLHSSQVNATVNRWLADAYGTYAEYSGRRANGNNGSQSAVLDGEDITALGGYGFGSSAYQSALGAVWVLRAGQNQTDAHRAQFWFCRIVPTDSTVAVTVLGVTDAGITPFNGYRILPGTETQQDNSTRAASTAYVDVAKDFMLAAGFPSNAALAASVSSNALTVALKGADGADPSASNPVRFPFRNVTAATGTPTLRSATAAQSLVISSGSTMGAIANKAFRLWIVQFDDGGTLRLGAINSTDANRVYPLDRAGFASSTAEGGAGAADSAGTLYTGTAVTTKAFVVIGFLEWSSGLATPGTWGAGPDIIETCKPGVRMPGDIVSIQHISRGTALDVTSNTPQATALKCTIALKSKANKLCIDVAGMCGADWWNTAPQFTIKQDSTQIWPASGRSTPEYLATNSTDSALLAAHFALKAFVSPNTVTAADFEVYLSSVDGASHVYLNRNHTSSTVRGESNAVFTEISA